MAAGVAACSSTMVSGSVEHLLSIIYGATAGVSVPSGKSEEYWLRKILEHRTGTLPPQHSATLLYQRIAANYDGNPVQWLDDRAALERWLRALSGGSENVRHRSKIYILRLIAIQAQCGGRYYGPLLALGLQA
jgi:hypothetical protein